MTRIGLISDTHSYLDPKVFEYLKACDEIWHAGDIGDSAVTDALAAFKPLRAVFGNIDGHQLRAEFKEDELFQLEGFKVLITHIGGYPGHYSPRSRQLIVQHMPDIFICGHSHILRVMKDPKYNNMLMMNPGAAGVHGFHKMKTLLRFDLNQGRILNLEAIELGKRGALS